MKKIEILCGLLILLSFGLEAQNWKWASTIESDYQVMVNDVAINSAGTNSYAVGDAPEGISFGINLNTTPNNVCNNQTQGTCQNGFLASYNLAGVAQWVVLFESPSSVSYDNVELKLVDVDQSGDIYVAGKFSGESLIAYDTDNIGTHILNNHNGATNNNLSSDYFVAKYNSLGFLQWINHIGGIESDDVIDMEIDHINDKIFVLGSVPDPGVNGPFNSISTQSSSTLINSSSSNLNSGMNRNTMVITSFDFVTGDLIDHVDYTPSPTWDMELRPAGIAVNIYGDVFVTANSMGLSSSSMTIGTSTFFGDNALVLGFNNILSVNWVKYYNINSGESLEFSRVTTDKNGNPIFIGAYDGINPGLATANYMGTNGGIKPFVKSIDSNTGNDLWAKGATVPGSSNAWTRHLDIYAECEEIYLVGQSRSSQIQHPLANGGTITFPGRSYYYFKLNYSGDILTYFNHDFEGGSNNSTICSAPPNTTTTYSPIRGSIDISDYGRVIVGGVIHNMMPVSLSANLSIQNSYQCNHNYWVSDGFIGELNQDLQANITAVDCYGDSTGSISLNPTGITGPLTYSWSTGASTSSITGLAAGTYTVTLSYGNGCLYEEEITVPEPDPITVSFQSSFDCLNNMGSVTASASGGVAPYTYKWSWGASGSHSGPSLSNMPGGVYTLTITDANGCTYTTSFALASMMTIEAEGEEAGCDGTCTGSIRLNSVTSSFDPFTILVDGLVVATGVMTSNLPYLTPANLCPGYHTVVVEDATTCRSTEISVLVPIGNRCWEQSTFVDDLMDHGFDIDIDEAGNTYAVGDFQGASEFICESTLFSINTMGTGMFTVRIDPCGDIDWVSSSTGNHGSTYMDGRAITLDEANNRVYVTGSFDKGAGNITVFGDINTSTNASLVGQGSMYVAAFDLNTGALDWVWENSVANSFFRPRGIGVIPGDAVLVAGHFINATGDQQSFISRVNTIATTPNLGYTEYILPSDVGAIEVEDLEIQSGADGLFVISGRFLDLYFNPLGSNLISANGGAGYDGFIAQYADNISSATLQAFNQLHANQGPSVVRDVSVNYDQSVFFTGTVQGGTHGSFGGSVSIPQEVNSSMFIGRLESNLSWQDPSSWLHYTDHKTMSCEGMGIDVHQDVAMNVGNALSSGSIQWKEGSTGINIGYPVTALNANRVSTSQWNQAGGFIDTRITEGSPSQAVQSSEAVALNHPEGITPDGESFLGFTTGRYEETMIFVTMPDIVSGPGTQKSFFARTWLNGMGMPYARKKRKHTNPLEIEPNIIPEARLSIYPNPSKGEINIRSNKTVNQIELYDLQGKKIREILTNASQQINISLEAMRDGIYLIRIIGPEIQEQKKLIISH